MKKEIINTSFIDNSAATTQSSSNDYTCSDTFDKVYLLSWQEAINPNYGFSTDPTIQDEVRKGIATDYARSLGCYIGYIFQKFKDTSPWLLRSPNINTSNVSYVNYSWNLYSSLIPSAKLAGIRPAISIAKENHTHSYSSKIVSSTCITEGYTMHICSCGDSYTTNYTGYGFHDYVDGKCRYCNKINVDNNIYIENDNLYINLGRYPQTVVTDESIISALSSISFTNSKGYIEYNGNEYKKIFANPYDSYNFNNGNEIIEGNTYYYLVEPIKWRIITEDDDTYTLLSEIALDNICFYGIDSERIINGNTVYPNNYEYSNIRAWLNGYNGTSYDVDDYTNKGFIDIAFNMKEKELINLTLVDNSEVSLGTGYSSYICNDTNDKVYLLSYQDITNFEYGFNTDQSRKTNTTDYIRSVGCSISTGASNYGYCYWWLRSPYVDYPHSTSLVRSDGLVIKDGNMFYFGYINYTFYGVRPAITISKY